MTRVTNPWTHVLIALVAACLLYLFFHEWESNDERHDSEAASAFVYILAGTGFLLTLAVEFVYLRDSFGTRMNTVFKFYYQAWVMLALAAAFGVYHLLSGSRSQVVVEGVPVKQRLGAGRVLWAVPLVALVLVALIYPVLAIPSKAGDSRAAPTLDGMAYLEGARGDDFVAMKWLQENVKGTARIVESTGGSYSEASWVSAFTGLPTVLGWDFHEHQWRGNSTEANLRRPDIAQIYQNTNSDQVLALLDKYGVEYVYVGPVERSKYELSANTIERLGRFLEKVYENNGVHIFRR